MKQSNFCLEYMFCLCSNLEVLCDVLLYYVKLFFETFVAYNVKLTKELLLAFFLMLFLLLLLHLLLYLLLYLLLHLLLLLKRRLSKFHTYAPRVCCLFLSLK